MPHSCGGGRRTITAPGGADTASGAAAAEEAAPAAEAAGADGGCGADGQAGDSRPLSADITGAEGKDSLGKAEGKGKPGKLQIAEEHNSSSRWYGKPAIGDATTPKSPIAVFGTEKISAQRTAKVSTHLLALVPPLSSP